MLAPSICIRGVLRQKIDQPRPRRHEQRRPARAVVAHVSSDVRVVVPSSSASPALRRLSGESSNGRRGSPSTETIVQLSRYSPKNGRSARGRTRQENDCALAPLGGDSTRPEDLCDADEPASRASRDAPNQYMRRCGISRSPRKVDVREKSQPRAGQRLVHYSLERLVGVLTCRSLDTLAYDMGRLPRPQPHPARSQRRVGIGRTGRQGGR